MPKRNSPAKVRGKKLASSRDLPSKQPTLHGIPHNPDVEAEPLTTKAEMEAHIRGLNLRCQGPQIAEQMDRWQKLMAAGKEDEARLVSTREGCGYDFGQTVLSEPFDGKEHESECPQCGTVTSWRSPVFEGLNEAGKK